MPEIPGLDQEAGLKRVLGKTGAYLDMLRKYASNQRETLPQIRTLLAQAACEEAIRLAHTLKGVAGNIGAGSIMHQAARLETSLQSGEEHETLLAQLEEAQAQLLSHLDALLPQTGSPQPAAPQAIAPLVERLKTYLEDGDPSAGEWLATHQASFRAAFPEQIAALNRAIEQFDYDQASALLAVAASPQPAQFEWQQK